MIDHAIKPKDFGNVSIKNHTLIALPPDKPDLLATEKANIYFWKIFSAGFYGLSSFFIIVVNKIVLTNYK